MMRQKNRAPITRILHFVTQPFEFTWIESGGSSAKLVVQRCVNPNELPVCIAQAKVAGALLKLVQQIIERLTSGVEVVVTGENQRSDIAGLGLENVFPGSVEVALHFRGGAGIVNVTKVYDDVRILLLDLTQYFQSF